MRKPIRYLALAYSGIIEVRTSLEGRLTAKIITFLVAKQLYEPLMSFFLSFCLSPFFIKLYVSRVD